MTRRLAEPRGFRGPGPPAAGYDRGVNPLAFGIAAGLTAACFSSLSYLVSRHHGTRRPGGSRRLLLLAHLVMAAACVPAVAALLPAGVPVSALATRAVCLACLVSTASYFVGTACVFHALTKADASRLSPLLGLKVVALALIVSLVLGQRLDVRQWAAVALCGGAVLMLQRGGASLPPRAFVLVAGSCVLFAIADLGIVAMIDAVQQAVPLDRLRAGGLALALTYVTGGLVVLPLVVRDHAGPQPPTADDWLGAAQYAATWLVAMIGLYACYGAVGVVLGTVLQSTRGVMSVGIGAVLAHLGWHDLESRVDRRMLVRRFAAAVLMTAAIAIYVGNGS